MSDRVTMWRGPPMMDVDPVPLRKAASAAVDALRLAWQADQTGLLVVAAINAGTVAAEIAQLLASGRAVDAVVEGDKARSQTSRLLVLGALGLVTVAGKSASGALAAPLRQATLRRGEGRILDVVAAMELADVEDPRFQDRLQQAFAGARSQSMLLESALSVPAAVAGVAGSLAAIGANDRILVPLGLMGTVPRWLLMRRAPDPMAAMRYRSREGRESAIIRHYLTGTNAAHELRAFGATPFLRDRHDRLAEDQDKTERTVQRQHARRRILSALAGQAAEAPAASRLLVRVTRKEASVADGVAGGLGTRKMAGGIQRVVDMVTGMRRTAALAGDARDFVEDLPPPHGGPVPPPTFTRIRVEGLRFTYPGGDAPVLDGVDLEIRHGEVVALVGENGSGKTTLAKILCRLYRPTGGSVRWDDLDLATCDPAGVRSRIAVVFQDFVRYPSLTAAENIGIGRPARMGDRAAIVEAARRAGASEAIEALPQGYDTVLSRQFDGVDLSTGQWQRVALARAFLRDAALVVLDEPTAALDPRAERDLFEAVAALYRSRSAVLISHRLSSVRFADRICVLAGGRITEAGTHEQLLGLGRVYAELFELQARAYR